MQLQENTGSIYRVPVLQGEKGEDWLRRIDFPFHNNPTLSFQTSLC